MPPKFIVRRNLDFKEFMKVKGTGITWVDDPNIANFYPSKYAAKKHLNRLDDIPQGIIIELLATN